MTDDRTYNMWNSEELACVIPGEAIGGTFVCRGVSIDSRTIQPGDAFLALKGPNFDGHDYIDEAVAMGAAGVIAQHAEVIDCPQVITGDTYLALWKIAAAARKRFQGRVVAITGSVGKTSLKDMISHAFRKKASVYASPGNYNNQIGIPLSWCNCPMDVDVAVMELGMNKRGEIDNLSQLSKPHVAVLTPVGQAHRANFSDLNDILRAKLEILAGLAKQKTFVFARNGDDRDRVIIETVRNKYKVRDVAIDAQADVALNQISLNDKGTAFTLSYGGQKYSSSIKAYGDQWPLLAGLVVSVGQSMDIAPIDELLARLKTYSPLSGRGRIISTRWHDGDSLVIDESYNASPESMNQLIRTLGSLTAQRKILVIGQMLELGTEEDAAHRKLAAMCVDHDVDAVFACGDAMRHTVDALSDTSVTATYYRDVTALWDRLRTYVKHGDLIAIKGSLAMNMRFIVEQLSLQSEDMRTSAVNKSESARALSKKPNY